MKVAFLRRPRLPLRRWWWWLLPVVVLCLGMAGYVAAPMDTGRYLAVVPSGEMVDRAGQPLYVFLNGGEQWCFPQELEGFGSKLREATVAVEDQRFWRHPGVDPAAVLRAAWANARGRRVVSGASTITMQVVKLADETPRTLWGKLAQAGTALRLDWHASKGAILAAYLNRAPYGLNLVGAEAAAWRYFGKPAAELDAAEAALLAGLPKAPSALEPLGHAKAARARRDHVLGRMAAEGCLNAAEAKAARARPAGAAWHDFPRRAPHLAAYLGAAATTLDGELQAAVEDLLPQYLKRFDGEVTNGAVMVARVATGEVLVRVGGADFFAGPVGGQVDLCRAARSPGSTLKPFTYGLALERQALYPCEQLLDDTLDYGQYSPGNFDGSFNGLIPARDALRLSLNVPAVTVAERVGAGPLADFLRAGGLTTLTGSAEHYGLGLTLGNCEARLDELLAAYCAVANLGAWRPLRETPGPPVEAVPWLSPGTALALYGMLEQPFPGEAESGLARMRGTARRAAWKTGTSTGLHDAWAFVFNRQYVVGAWLGNNDGAPSRRLVGAHAALPLAARVFRMLPPLPEEDWPAPDGAMREAVVCPASGLPAGEACPHTETVLLPARQWLHRRCDVHRPGGVARWPGTARGWDLAAVKEPVVLAGAERAVALRILAPPDGAEYVLTGLEDGDQVQARASLAGQAPLHWYLDSGYLGEHAPGDAPWIRLTPGEHRLVCLAASGETDSVAFTVSGRAR